MCDFVLLRELHKLVAALHTVLGLIAARLVIESGVDHTRVVARLMGGQMAFLFQHKDPQMRESQLYLIGTGKSHHTSSHHDHIISVLIFHLVSAPSIG
jgi:hypothetical protein